MISSHAFMRSSCALLALLLFAGCTLPTTPTSENTVSSFTLQPIHRETSSLPSNQPPSLLEERILPTGALEIGHAEAPIAFTLFTNHSCEYCRLYDQKLMDYLLEEFVETGIMRVSIIPVPLQKYPEGERHMQLLHCAALQGKGLLMHRALFTDEPDTEEMTAMEIDTEALSTCLVATENQRVFPDSDTTRIPSYTINTAPYIGLPEWSELRGQINAER